MTPEERTALYEKYRALRVEVLPGYRAPEDPPFCHQCEFFRRVNGSVLNDVCIYDFIFHVTGDATCDLHQWREDTGT